MPIYIYESHMGGIYFSDYEYDFHDLYCEQCGDSDWFIGEVYSAEEAFACLANMISIDGSGGYDLEYILKQMDYFENIPSFECAKEIVIKNKEIEEEE